MILNLFDRMKLPFRKNKEFLKALYDILGFYPHNIEIYRIAFSHKSLSYRRDAAPKDRKGNKDKRPKTENTAKPLNNERLEYLGDAVLETVVSDILFRHFEHKREGFLTSTRSKIVQREALNRLAEQMGLENLILAAQGTRMSHTNIGGNAFEALMGAIYLDRGYKFCHWFITHRVIGPYVDLDSVAQKEVNFKSKLLEWCQKNRINTNFRDFTNNDGEKGFRSTIVLEGITVGKGSGRSKKESQQLAAKDALLRMRREQKLYDSIFRAKEKRTAMEADESFALPKLDEIESVVKRDRGGKKPVLESERADEQDSNPTDAAYDAAYNEEAKFEVIAGNADTESEYSEYATDIQPDDAANEPAADTPLTYTPAERPEPMTKAQRKRERNRTAKTVGDAVKSTNKGRTSTDEPADNRKAKAEKAEQRKAEKPEKAEKSEKPEKAEKSDKAEKAEKDVKAEKAEQRKANKPEASAEKPANRKAKAEKASNEAPTETEKASQTQQVKATEEKTLTAAERNAARKARRERRLAESAASANETSLANDGQEAPAEDEPLITLQATITEMVEESPAQQTEETEASQVISQVITEADEEPLQTETPQPQTADEPQPATSDETVAEEETEKQTEEEAEGTVEEAAAAPAATADNRPALQAVLSELMERHAPSQPASEAPADEPKPEDAAAESPVATEQAEAEAQSEEAEAETQEAESTVTANDAEAEATSDEDAEAEGSDNEDEGANEEEEAYEKAEDEEENLDEEDSDAEDSDEESLDEETEEFPEAAAEKDAAEAAVLTQNASSATRPILRHLTLDDFVFGATDGTSHEAPLSSESADGEEEALTDTAAPRRKRKPRRRNRRPKEAEANEASAAAQAPSDDRNTDRPAKNGHRAGQPKGQQKAKQKPEAKQQADPTKEERERAAKRRAAQRRRRRHSAGNELPPQGFDD